MIHQKKLKTLKAADVRRWAGEAVLVVVLFIIIKKTAPAALASKNVSHRSDLQHLHCNRRREARKSGQIIEKSW